MRGPVAMALAGLLIPTVMAVDTARADGDSIVTLGVGGGVGVRQIGGAGAERGFINQANVRLKFLDYFGLDFSVDLQRDPTLVAVADDLQYKAKMRLTALVYPYNGEYVGFYLGAGVGGAKVADLKRFDAPANSYTAGVGMEFHVASHFSIDVSFMVVIPGASSIKNYAIARVNSALDSGDPAELEEVSAAGLGDFVGLENNEIMLRLLLFL